MNLSKPVLICVVCLFPAVVLAEGADHQVTVTGRAEVRVVPDQVVMKFAAETMDEELDRSKRENDRIVNAVFAAAQTIDLPANQIATDFLQIESVFTTSRGESQFLGYKVTKSIVITLNELGSFEELLSAVLAAGVNRVQGIEFLTTEFRRHRDDAMLLALDAAREKAQAMAGRLGAAIGDPVLIKEGASRLYPSPSNTLRNLSQDDGWLDGPLAPGQLAIPAVVTVTFLLANDIVFHEEDLLVLHTETIDHLDSLE